ncbi:MAG: sulfatase [Myxococcales bacterium]|nr:sulfatase [Myxococcales bacterium]
MNARIPLALALLGAACGSEAPSAREEPTVEPEAAATAEAPAVPEAAPEEPPPLEGRTHLDLLRLAHLADVDRDGVFIPFGVGAHHKHTSGTWNSGWGSDGVAGEGADAVPFTRLSGSGRLFFDVREPSALTLRVRARNVGGGALLAFYGGEALGELAPVGEPSGGFGEWRVSVPAERVRRGDNQILLRAPSTRSHEGEEVSFEVASIHLQRGERAAGWAPPDLRPGPIVSAGAAREGLRLPAGTRASWYLEVPPSDLGEVRLRFGRVALAGEPRVRVRVTAEGGEPLELLDEPATSGWQRAALDLGRVAGKLVRLDVESEGGEVGLSELRVTLPEVELAAIGSAEVPHAKHVVVLVIDTLRADALRPYAPRSRVETPALERFAREGVVFERAQSPENWTKPACASILTSLFPATHGAKNDSSRLPQSALTLGEVFQQHGFRTGSFIANGYVSRAFGFDQGWDHYTNYIREQRNTDASNVFREAGAWIAAQREADPDQRLFLYVQTIDPHVPYDPPDEHLRRYDARPDYDGPLRNKRRSAQLLEDAKRNPPRIVFTDSDKTRLRALYDGEISDHDEHFGRFLERLRELEMLDDTIFVITSDHGEEFEDHGSWGHGHSIFQELIRVPLLVRWPAGARAGHRVPQVVSTMNVGPTVLEAAGLPVPAVFEGRSMMGFLRGVPPAGPWVAFSDFQENRRVIRGMDWKLVLRSSLTHVLFDLERDPGERNDRLDVTRHPIAMRYLRVLAGQQLGARDRARWLEGDGGAGPGMVAEDAEMNLELCQQLVALGYMDCTNQFPGAI